MTFDIQQRQIELVQGMPWFKKAFEFLIKHEGGTNFHLLDRGGLTKYGISQKQYPDLDIASLTLDDARDIYIRDYWLKNQCNHLGRKVPWAVFDSGVNCGAHSGAVWLQKALNNCGANLKPDGIIGPKTLASAQNKNEYAVCMKLLAFRLGRYYRLTGSNPDQLVFIRGWIRRVQNLQLAI